MQPDPTTEEERQALLTQEQADRVQAALSTPLPSTTPLPSPSSTVSELTAVVDLSQVLVTRVDQVARASAEQWARVEGVLQQMVETMRLAQIMIAQQDQTLQRLTEHGNQQELVTAALVKVNANLSQIVAALLTNDQKG